VKRRRVFIIVSGCVTALVAALLLWPHEREPEYNGATLSTWLSRCGSTNLEESLAAGDAIRHMGTNALPLLLRWIQHEPGWRDSLGKKILKWPVVGGRPDVQRLICGETQHRADTAVTAFKILGLEARPALPELRRLAHNSQAPQTANRATECLISTTPEGYFDPGPIIIHLYR
jgi:hypothetical protein